MMLSSLSNIKLTPTSPWSMFDNNDPWLYVSIIVFVVFALVALVIHLREYPEDDDTPKIFKAGFTLLAMAWNMIYVIYKLLF